MLEDLDIHVSLEVHSDSSAAKGTSGRVCSIANALVDLPIKRSGMLDLLSQGSPRPFSASFRAQAFSFAAVEAVERPSCSRWGCCRCRSCCCYCCHEDCVYCVQCLLLELGGRMLPLWEIGGAEIFDALYLSLAGGARFF